MSIAKQWLSKQVSTTTDTQATIEGLLGMMFYVRPMQSGNKGRELVKWCSVGSWATKRRLYMFCSVLIFGARNSLRLLKFLC
jgi:hypothetical protein